MLFMVFHQLKSSLSRKDSGAQATGGEKRQADESGQVDLKCDQEIKKQW